MTPSTPLPLRVLHAVRPASGGIRQHVLHLIRYSDPARILASLAAPPAFLASLPSDLPLKHRFPLAIASRFSPVSDLKAAFKLRALARQESDIVHAHGLRAAWIAALTSLLSPFPWVATLHNLLGAGALTKYAVRLIARQAAHIIVVSPAIANSLITLGVSATKISVIPNGIPLNDYEPRPIEDRQQWNIPEGDFVVGCIARLSYEKGVDVLIQAAKEMPDTTVLIAGDGPELPRLSHDLPPNCRLLGRIEDVRSLFSVSDVIAIPSRQEGQGIVALEAMACGVPIVASRVGGLAEMLTDQQTALLVPSENSNAMAEAIGTLRAHPELCNTLRANGRTLVRERYDVTQMVAEITRVYQNATKSSRAA